MFWKKNKKEATTEDDDNNFNGVLVRQDPRTKVKTTSAATATTNTFVQNATIIDSNTNRVTFQTTQKTVTHTQQARVTEIFTRRTPTLEELQELCFETNKFGSSNTSRTNRNNNWTPKLNEVSLRQPPSPLSLNFETSTDDAKRNSTVAKIEKTTVTQKNGRTITQHVEEQRIKLKPTTTYTSYRNGTGFKATSSTTSASSSYGFKDSKGIVAPNALVKSTLPNSTYKSPYENRLLTTSTSYSSEGATALPKSTPNSSIWLKTSTSTSALPKTSASTSALPKSTASTSALPKTSANTSAWPKTSTSTSALPKTSASTSALPKSTASTSVWPKTSASVNTTSRSNNVLPSASRGLSFGDAQSVPRSSTASNASSATSVPRLSTSSNASSAASLSSFSMPVSNNNNRNAIPTSKKQPKLKPAHVYIFNHEKFDNPQNEFRKGSACDESALDRTFKQFKCKVTLIKNGTRNKVCETVKKIQMKDFNDVSSVVIVILSHGSRHDMIAAKDGDYSIDDDMLFPILNNATLRNKPKFFFVQACKGSMEVGKLRKDASTPAAAPVEIYKCYSTFEGYASYRTEEGSIFIQAFCEHLRRCGATKDIRSIMADVTSAVKQLSQDKQIPTVTSNLTQSYVFGDFV